MRKPQVLVAVVVLSVALPVWAGYLEDHAAAQAVMQQTTERLFARLSAEAKVYAEDERRLHAMLEEVVLPAVDMQLFSRLALGANWKGASNPQKQRFVKGIQSMLLKSYGKTLLLLLPDVQIEHMSPSPDAPRGKYQLVRTKVVTSENKPPVSIDYTLINREGWKVFDIIVNGTSLARQFRAGFDQEIREVGLEALIERLDKFDS